MISVALGCQEAATAIVVEFQIVGQGAAEARSLDILVRCDPEDDGSKRLHYDLSLLGDGVTPSLAIDTDQETPCPIVLAAQVYDESSVPIVVADRRLDYQKELVQRIVMVLDTGACEDLDEDGAVAGLGCPFDGPALLRDCDEFDSRVHEGAEEVCNGRDDDCNGMVDDIAPSIFEEACREPVAWRRDVGLCAFWKPRCINGAIICPELPTDDDCELPMDTNCDNRLSCGGCSDELLRSAPCNACQEARCDGDEVLCVEREDLDPPPGSPCVESPCGTWMCEPGSGEMICVPGTYSEEICDDPEGLDEDCDGLANELDDDCVQIVPSEIECLPIFLPTAGSGWSDHDFTDCDLLRVFDLGGCEFLSSSGSVRNETQLLVFVTVPDNITVSLPEVQGCCGCDVRYNASVAGYDLQAFVVEESLLRFLAMSAHDLEILVPVHIQRGGNTSGYTVTLVVPIIEDPSTNACDTFCDIPIL